jgi:hypothetical protein
MLVNEEEVRVSEKIGKGIDCELERENVHILI